MEFVLASHNAKKCKEVQEILMGNEIQVHLLPENAPEPIEDGESFAENALIKARAACTLLGMPALADDSGLCVDALDGAPGIYSARYCEGSDADRNALLLRNMAQVADADRMARFVCAIACVFPDGREFTVQGMCEGKILHEVQGAGGFGYDPLFYVEGYDCTFGELPPQIKNKISHRANALAALQERLCQTGWDMSCMKQTEDE